MNLGLLAKMFLPMLENMAAQEILTGIVGAKIPNADVQAFIAGTFAGTFPTVHLTIHGFHVNMTDADIKDFLTRLKKHDWQGMLEHAEASILK